MKMYATVCPRNCYSTCSLHVYVEDGRIRRVEANPENLAASAGTCLRGLSYVERTHSPDRLLYPLRRKADGAFERISWDQALDEIVARLTELKKTYGAQSVMFYAASGTKGLLNEISGQFWRLTGGYTATYGDLCWPAGLEATRLTLGENKHNAPWDLENARLIILWGKNPAETNVQQMRAIDRAIAAGARLFAIDPRRTLSAEKAELILQPRPGTDGALALALGNLLIRWNAVDENFIRQYVLGFPEYRELTAAFPPEKAADICGLPLSAITALARAIADIKPASFLPGYGMQRFTNSGQTMRAILALPVITGNIGRPGAGWHYANLQTFLFHDVIDPIAFFPPETPNDIVRVSVSTARLGQDMLSMQDPPIKMIWVERGNPVTQNPETHTVLKAFRALDFRVVVDQFMTDTAREADIILPAKSLFEQTDVIGAYWHPYLQLKQKILPCPGEVKPETEIYRLLAERLGFTPQQMAGRIPEVGDEAVERYLESRLARVPGLTLERLRQGPVIAPGAQEIAFSDFVFRTPSGKIELFSHETQTRWGLDPLPVYREPEESVRSKASGGETFPLYFMTPNTKNATHSQFINLKLIRRFAGEPFLMMAPGDAAARGIAHGDRVRIFNLRGQLETAVRIDFGLREGCVCMPNGRWISDGGTVNFLSLGRETDLGYGAAFHDNLVQVEKLT